MDETALNYVWDTAILRPTSPTGLLMAFRNDGSHNEAVPGADQMYVRAERVPEGGLPNSMYIYEEFPQDDKQPVPPIVTPGGKFVVVSPEVKAVMERFDLGASQFAPVTLLKSDRKTAFEGEHFILNYACVKEGFEPEHSENFVAQKPGRSLEWLGNTGLITKDDQTKVNASVLNGPDLWKDPRLNRALFFSDALMKALLAEGLFPDGYNRLRCVVVPAA